MDFKKQFVEQKVGVWCQDVRIITEMAKEDPQATFCAFNLGVSQRWKCLQRTVSNISDCFAPLSKLVREELIPAFVGKSVSDEERKTLALPYK